MKAPSPFGPVPSERQLRWHALEYYGFIHFTVNTFTDKEWGYGDESPSVFNPTDFDADQIAETAANGGMAGLILTCKHHDGFCLWPSKYTEHSVKNSPWRKGKGDVVKELSEACRKKKIRFGTYLSPWDRNHAEYGRPAYLEYFRNQLNELTTEYGELFEVWFDGANGGDGFYGGAREARRIDRKTYYDWKNTWEIVRRNQPQAVLFSDAGPDIRWVGNERGFAGEPCWATFSAASTYPGFLGDQVVVTDMVQAWAADQVRLNHGDRKGADWLPAECDVSIRPGWFYHAAQDDKVRDPENLLDLYFKSVGRGASLLLNLPPDRRGRIHENDVKNLLGFRKRLDAIFGKNLAKDASSGPAALCDGNPSTFWTADNRTEGAEAILEFTRPVTFNVVGLREYLPLGQRVEGFAVDVDDNGTWREYATGTSIGSRRLVRGRDATTRRVRLRILNGPACPAISELGLFLDSKVSG